MNSSFPFRNIVYYRTGRGVHGQGMSMDGAKGEDVVVKVPARMVARESGNEEVLLWSCLVGEGMLRSSVGVIRNLRLRRMVKRFRNS